MTRLHFFQWSATSIKLDQAGRVTTKGDAFPFPVCHDPPRMLLDRHRDVFHFAGSEIVQRFRTSSSRPGEWHDLELDRYEHESGESFEIVHGAEIVDRGLSPRSHESVLLFVG